ncbi:tRNA (guanine(46)-N(7))-methyltransferase TrmB [Inquilinus sp. CAU 1745]|uniref:tRNA (guanine(46)-N(7))-methyltransferase TrmB n=1 Tax=Inquilinus sp. CAU 1745 TaxID=3140369 RepID=UPI00325A7C91
MSGTGQPAARRLYGRRQGRKLRTGQAALLDDVLPRLRIALPDPPVTLDPAALFPRPVDDLWLEIGFGGGEHLSWQADRNRNVGLIGCEPFINGISTLLRDVEALGLDNVRIHPDDARPLIEALPDGCVGRTFLLFADPWPKARHHKRRFIQPETLDVLARILRSGAELRLASDNPGLVDWMLFHTRRHPAFRWTAERPADWRTRPADWPATRYEKKRLHGVPAFLRFVRR